MGNWYYGQFAYVKYPLRSFFRMVTGGALFGMIYFLIFGTFFDVLPF